MTAKAVLGLLEAGVPVAAIVRRGVPFGTAHRREGWGAGLTVLVAMANLLPALDPADRALALVQGLAFVSRDTRGHPDRFPLAPLPTEELERERLAAWYRRFIDTRNADAAERTLATAVAGGDRPTVERLMFAAATDHVFLDEGHALDFTNKAFECARPPGLGGAAAACCPPSWPRRPPPGATRRRGRGATPTTWPAWRARRRRGSRGWARPPWRGPASPRNAWWSWRGSCSATTRAGPSTPSLEVISAGATPEQVGRAVALAAGLRITRFHVQNDHGDWDVVHHGFTYANALHQALARAPSVELLRGAVHGALKVYLDRFLNLPAARPPRPAEADLAELGECWDEQGQVDRAGAIVYNWVRGGGDPAAAIAAVGGALVAEDAEFHWFQTVEAAARQARAWPDGSEPQALLLAGAARFLAAHTPTRRELPQVVRIATRLRRGDNLYEES